jgi:hypothetical protein
MYDSSQSDAYHEHSIKKVNYVLGSVYLVLGVLSIIQVITKYPFVCYTLPYTIQPPTSHAPPTPHTCTLYNASKRRIAFLDAYLVLM